MASDDEFMVLEVKSRLSNGSPSNCDLSRFDDLLKLISETQVNLQAQVEQAQTSYGEMTPDAGNLAQGVCLQCWMPKVWMLALTESCGKEVFQEAVWQPQCLADPNLVPACARFLPGRTIPDADVALQRLLPCELYPHDELLNDDMRQQCSELRMPDDVASKHQQAMQALQMNFERSCSRLRLCQSTRLAALVESFCGTLSLAVFCLLESVLACEPAGNVIGQFCGLIQVGSLGAGTDTQTSDHDVLARWHFTRTFGEAWEALDLLRVASCKLRKVCEELEKQSQDFKLFGGNRPLVADSDRFVLHVRGRDVDLLPGLQNASVFNSMIFRTPTALENYSGNVERSDWLRSFPVEVRGVVRAFKRLNDVLARKAHAAAYDGVPKCVKEFKKSHWLSSYGMSLIVIAIYLLCKDHLRTALLTVELVRAVCKCFATLDEQDSLRLSWKFGHATSLWAMPDDVARLRRESRGSEAIPAC